MNSSDNMFDAEITISFVINDVCFASDLDEFDSFEDLVMDLINTEGLFSFISDEDHYIIEKIRKI